MKQQRHMDFVGPSKSGLSPQPKPRAFPVKPVPQAGRPIMDVAAPKPKPLAHMAPLAFRPYKPPEKKELSPVVPAQPEAAPKPTAAIPQVRPVPAVKPAAPAPPAVSRFLPTPIIKNVPIVRVVDKTPATIPMPRPNVHPVQSRTMADRSPTWKFAALAAVSLVALIIFGVSFGESLILAYLVAAIILPIDSKVSFLVALGLLALQPLLIIIKLTGPAESYAVYAYYFLCIGVLSALVEYRRNA